MSQPEKGDTSPAPSPSPHAPLPPSAAVAEMPTDAMLIAARAKLKEWGGTGFGAWYDDQEGEESVLSLAQFIASQVAASKTPDPRGQSEAPRPVQPEAAPTEGLGEEDFGTCVGHLGPPHNTNEPHREGGTCYAWKPGLRRPAAPVPTGGMRKCGSCQAGNHERCTSPGPSRETENDGGLAFFRLCCCHAPAPTETPAGVREELNIDTEEIETCFLVAFGDDEGWHPSMSAGLFFSYDDAQRYIRIEQARRLAEDEVEHDEVSILRCLPFDLRVVNDFADPEHPDAIAKRGCR